MYAQPIDQVLAGTAIPGGGVWDGCGGVVFTRNCDNGTVVYDKERACDRAGGEWEQCWYVEYLGTAHLTSGSIKS